MVKLCSAMAIKCSCFERLPNQPDNLAATQNIQTALKRTNFLRCIMEWEVAANVVGAQFNVRCSTVVSWFAACADVLILPGIAFLCSQ